MDSPRAPDWAGRTKVKIETEVPHKRLKPFANARRRVGARLPWGVFGMLALVGGIEWFVAGHPRSFSDPVSWSWRLSAEAAQRDAPGCAVLCVGDSLVKHGVIPSVLESKVGGRVCNLAVARGPAPATYFLLKRALEAGAAPKAVVLDFKPSVLVGSAEYNLRYWQEILTAREILDLARRDHGGSLFVKIAVGRLLPSVRGRLEVRGAILAAFKGEESPMLILNRICERNWGVNQGANVAAQNPAFNGEVSEQQHKTLLSHLWYSHRANRKYVDEIFKLTAERSIPVYWLLPPVSPALQARREQTGAEEGYLGFVRDFQSRYSHVTVVDGRHAGYPSSAFVDATHLDGRGAQGVSSALGAILQERLDGRTDLERKRWVNLPRFDPNVAPLPLEDVEESRKVVMARVGAGTTSK